MSLKSLVLLAVSLLIFSQQLSTQPNVFTFNTVQKFEIYFSQSNWDELLDTLKATTDDYLLADSVVINGTALDSVGVKYKGNSSYDAESKKNSFTLDLDEFKKHAYQGLTKYKLHNLYLDPSMIREPLAYSILREYMVAPRSNFTEVYVNGNYHGLYANTEDISKTFVAERFASKKSNAFIKCSPPITPGPAVKSNLRYISEDSSDYENFYEMESDTGWNELVRICDIVSNKPEELDSLMNIDAALWMLAFDMAIVNLDSYIGAFSQNYFLYKSNNGQYTPICWDMNMTFGGFPFIGSSNTSLGALSIAQLKTLPIAAHANDPWWPLIVAVQNNPTWKRMYQAHLRTMVQEQLITPLYEGLASELHNLVEPYVLRDTNKTFSNEEFYGSFTNDVNVGSYSVPGIVTLMTDRTEYLASRPELTAQAPEIGAPVVRAGLIEQQVHITAAIGGANVLQVICGIRYDSTSRFRMAPMFDDGDHGDGVSGDGVYGAVVDAIPSESKFYIYAENETAGIFSPARARYQLHPVAIVTSVDDQTSNVPSAPYPNPATSSFTAPVEALGGKIIDARGVVVIELIDHPTVNISALPTGVYRIVKGAGSWPVVVVR